MSLKFEMCVENFDGALIAHEKKADFIELCDNLAVGGTTPSYGVLSLCILQITTPITVLIRPRGGDFIYTKEEIEIVREDIIICKKLGYNSVRVGALTPNQELNEEAMKLWKEAAGDMGISCHMAFDDTKNLKQSLDTLINWGYDGILTKGASEGHALSNQAMLKELIEHAQGRIEIIPGKGVTHKNVQDLAKNTRATRLHGTQIL